MKKRKKFTLLTIVAAVLAALAFNSFPPVGIDGLSVTFVDVEQGDSILLKTEAGKVILVDTGEKDVYKQKLSPMLRDNGISKIDLLVASHYHSDHIGAIADVFEDFDIDNLIIPDYEPHNNTKKKLLKLAKSENSAVYQLSAGDTLPDVDPDLSISVLHPGKGGFSDDENSNSFVLMVRYFNTSILLTGDVEEDAEKVIAKEYDIEVDILKVAHHGSRTSSCKEFLEAVDPTFAVIQCGKDNSYGHPHSQITAALEDDDVRIYRTDLDGSITFNITERGIGTITTTKD